MRTIEWKEGAVVTIDQTKLPNITRFLSIKNCKELSLAIKEMKLRGAPLIGVAAASGLALTAYHSKAKEKKELLRELENSANILKGTRPTAVNLFWAVNRVLKKSKETTGDVKALVEVVVKEAQKMAEEDVEINRRIGEHGSRLIDNGDVVLTHCNAGSLATVDYGTALGVIRTAWKLGKQIKVIATETRPRLQGARLTAFELKRDDIPVTLITDSTVGYAMSKRLVKKVIVGADRIVRDAVINKIGTYTIAVLAQEHGIPFYVAAPTSTFDLTRTSKEVTIEERSPEEITNFASQRIAPKGVDALNPAFDVTPIKYVSAIICETGILSTTEFEKLTHSTKRV